jgi:hypothetical protein
MLVVLEQAFPIEIYCPSLRLFESLDDICQHENTRLLGGSDQPVRRERYQTHETLQWRNAAPGASLRVSYSSEQIELGQSRTLPGAIMPLGEVVLVDPALAARRDPRPFGVGCRMTEEKQKKRA